MGPAIKEEVKKRYREAAQTPAPELCCPTDYDRKALNLFIPEEVLKISYGCGTPAGIGSIQPKETVLDIGSGGGIDCFIASRNVGPSGKVIGIDMTDEMLEVSRRNAPVVADRLGYRSVNTEFRKGEAEAMPVEDASIDLVISNCVINLSMHKQQVFKEMFRVLRPGGRFTISDIVADNEVPQYLKSNARKWGECLTGALSARNYIKGLVDVGFRGLCQEKFFLWQSIDGINFLSLTLTGYKLGPNFPADAAYTTFKGPFSSVVDEEGKRFERGRPVRIEPRDVQRFSLPTYQQYFATGSQPQVLTEADPEFLRVLPKEPSCVWKGDYALLVGPFQQAQDDDHHCYHLADPVEICSKTVDVLQHDAYRGLFSFFNRAGQVVGQESSEVCGSSSETACC